eukprot:scaffold104768_cov51-Attheya_sp.AAC.1
MSSSSSESSASSSTSSILGTTEGSNGKKRRVQFKQRSSGPVEDILDPNRTVTSPASPSVLSTAIVTNKDSLALSNSIVAHPSFPTGAGIDKAAVPVTKTKSRLPPISATTAEYMSKKALATQAKTKRTATATTGKALSLCNDPRHAVQSRQRHEWQTMKPIFLEKGLHAQILLTVLLQRLVRTHPVVQCIGLGVHMLKEELSLEVDYE